MEYSSSDFFQNKSPQGSKKDMEKMSRRKFLNVMSGITATPFLVMLGIINQGELHDLLDEARSYGLEQEVSLRLNSLSSKIKTIKESYGIEVVIRDMYKMLKQWNAERKVENAASQDEKAPKPKTDMSDVIEQFENSIDQLALAISVWPKSMLRTLNKITIRGLNEEYAFGGHTDDHGFMDYANVNLGREINISFDMESTRVFPHEMVHHSEKFFLGSYQALDAIWVESMKILGIPISYIGGKKLNSFLPKYETLSSEDVVSGGFMRKYSASEACEDRATIFEDMFDASASELPSMQKMNGWSQVRKGYMEKVQKKKKLMQAFMYIFSFGEMDKEFFSVIDNPKQTSDKNYRNLLLHRKFGDQKAPKKYQEYKEKSYQILCNALERKELSPVFLNFLAELFSGKLSEGNWEMYGKTK